jgi:hypothetical protein
LFFKKATNESTSFLEDFSYIIGARNSEGEIAGLLKLLTNAGIKKEQGLQLAALAGLANGIKKSKNKIKADHILKEALKNMEDGSSNEVKAAIGEISKLLQ